MADVASAFDTLRTERAVRAERAAKRKAAAEETIRKRRRAENRVAASDDAFFDTRGTGPARVKEAPAAVPLDMLVGGDEAEAATPAGAAAVATAPRDHVCVIGLQTDIAKLYETVVRARLKDVKVKSVRLDWYTRLLHVECCSSADATTAALMCDGQNIFGSRLRAAVSDGSGPVEILVKNIQSHVTSELLTATLSRFGDVLRTRMYSGHALWQKAYVQFADRKTAQKACDALHGARNTVQDAPLFVEMTAQPGAKPSSGKGEKGGKGGKRGSATTRQYEAEDDASSDEGGGYGGGAARWLQDDF